MLSPVKIGKHFKLNEFLRSETAARMGKTIPEPPPEVLAQLRQLVWKVLDPLREELGTGITVLSGWRPLWLNKAVGGAKNSDHMTGSAADIIAYKTTPLQLALLVEKMKLPVKQCIHEFPPNGWVHVSVGYPNEKAKKEFLTAVKVRGKTVYQVGL